MNSENEPKEEHRRAAFASKKGEVVIRPHEYDGIQEYDQKLPNWWLITFFGAILFYLAYWLIYYQAGWIKPDTESVAEKMASIEIKKQDSLKETLATLSDDILVNEWATNASIVAKGESHYNQICFACHGPNLDAPLKQAPSLVDGKWKYGDRPMEIFKIINEGTPEDSAGMEGTGAKMLPRGGSQKFEAPEVAELVAFLISKNPADFEGYKK
jgi:cytochrome c oxidase cbb3-type subunit 3